MLQSKKSKLIAGIVFDIIGMLTPFILDLAWAPISSYLMNKMYKDDMGKKASIFVAVEELIPGLDFIPTFTIMWFYTYVIKSKQEEPEFQVID